MCIIMIYVVLGGFLRAVFPLLVVTLMFFYSRREWTTFLFFFRNEILLGLTAVYVHSVLCYLRHNTPWGIEGCAVFLPKTINSIKKKEKYIQYIYFFYAVFL